MSIGCASKKEVRAAREKVEEVNRQLGGMFRMGVETLSPRDRVNKTKALLREAGGVLRSLPGDVREELVHEIDSLRETIERVEDVQLPNFLEAHPHLKPEDDQ